MRNGSTVIRWSETQNDENDGLAMSSASCRSRTNVAAGNCSIPRVPLGGLYPKSPRGAEPGSSTPWYPRRPLAPHLRAMAHTGSSVTEETNRQAVALADMERL